MEIGWGEKESDIIKQSQSFGHLSCEVWLNTFTDYRNKFYFKSLLVICDGNETG